VNRHRHLALLVALLALVLATQGCGVINKLRAKNALNEGVREFNKGKYDEAEVKFAKAVELSPDLANAKLFHARTIYQQYDQHHTDEMAQQALKAYQEIIDTSKDNAQLQDQALAFQADIYDKLRKSAEENGEAGKPQAAMYRQKYHQALEARADLPAASNEIKSAVYYSIGNSYWNDAYKLSRPYVDVYSPEGKLKQPLPPERIDQMRPAVQKALEYLNKALEQNPEYADAWTIKKLALLQEGYVTTDPVRQKAIKAEMDVADKKAKDLYLKRKQEAQQNAPSAG
jgi:tetratricopeptide (TPR) repeat protein